jgi:hypothetical protein
MSCGAAASPLRSVSAADNNVAAMAPRTQIWFSSTLLYIDSCIRPIFPRKMSEIDDDDIELLIGEVKSHKEIWNIADENYHDRTKKRSAWISICQIFFSYFFSYF